MRLLPAPLVALLLTSTAACSKKDPETSSTAPSPGTPSAAAPAQAAPGAAPAAPSAGGAAFAVPRLVVTGGPHGGTYTVTSDRPACSFGLAGKDTWGIQYTAAGDAAPRAIQALIPGVPRDGGETTAFTLTLGFATSLTVQTRADMPTRGSGTVTVKGGDAPVITVRATTADDATIEAEIHCGRLADG